MTALYRIGHPSIPKYVARAIARRGTPVVAVLHSGGSWNLFTESDLSEFRAGWAASASEPIEFSE